eukprot:TRINITY_DN3957_c0_g2_i2.p1 TRINITY_DN3957_c0_g2~~TRINITY_DN3957_c0_g2_i2.p1  ORF type:complete len:302 (+),score=81.72 TRINITY_DN3957_c0_g2_i2:51-956(+)
MEKEEEEKRAGYMKKKEYLKKRRAPEGEDGDGKRLMPKKADFRMRAHINPLNDTPFPYPKNPDYVNWKLHFPLFFGGTEEENKALYLNTMDYPLTYDAPVEAALNGRKGPQVEILDIGCGFGGLSVALAKIFPTHLVFGMEIRDKLVNYVGERIRALRIETPGSYGNVSVIRTNTMRHLTNYFRRGQLLKLFFCFPDPHFKASNHRRRIINDGFLSEYAYLLRPGGRLYAVTDIEELHDWHIEKLNSHPQFRRLPESSLTDDPCVEAMQNETEEGKKVTRNGGRKFYCVYERVPTSTTTEQ